ncbi:MAG: outer membrane beta-barrel protein [Elusimicrobia bacterium]|nr:outer membrane beta-barrel protein [Elusimicrobiota bacterium]
MTSTLNPDFAIGHGIPQKVRDFFFLKTLNRRHRYAFAFFVEKAAGFFISVLAPIAKSGLNETRRLLGKKPIPPEETVFPPFSFGKKALLLLLMVIPWLAAPSLFAEESSPVFLALQAGGGSVFSPSGFTDTHKRPLFFGGRLGYQVSDQWSVGGQLSSYSIGSGTSPANNIRLSPLTAWAQREFPWTRLWTPYVLATLGVSRNNAEATSPSVSNTGWTAGLSLGLRLSFSDMQDLSIEVGAHRFSHATEEGRDLRLFEGSLVLRFFLPESWVPMKPNVDISDADLEIPLVSDEPEVELDPTLLAQEELSLLQNKIDENKIPPITFDSGSAILQTTSFEALEALGSILRRYPDVRVRNYGFVEETDTQKDSDALALARAQVVGTYVVQNSYLNEGRFLYLGNRAPPAPALRRIEFEAIAR